MVLIYIEVNSLRLARGRAAGDFFKSLKLRLEVIRFVASEPPSVIA